MVVCVSTVPDRLALISKRRIGARMVMGFTVALLAAVVLQPVRVGAEIVDPCVVRTEATVSAGPALYQIGVDANRRVYQMTNDTQYSGPGTVTTWAVRRFHPSGQLDSGYGKVVIPGFASAPRMAVAADGTVWLASFPNDGDRPVIRYNRIDPGGGLSTVREVGRANHYVFGVGAFDLGDRVLSGIVLIPFGGSDAVALVVDVETGAIVVDRTVPLVGDITAVSANAFALEDGWLSINGQPPFEMPVADTRDRIKVADLLEVDDTVIAVGSLDVSRTSSRPLFARYPTNGNGMPDVFRVGEELRAIQAITSDGYAVLEEGEANSWVVGQPRPGRDTEIVRIDLSTGEWTTVAAIDNGRAATGRLQPAVSTVGDSGLRIVTQADESSLFVFDLWPRTPAPPEPMAMTGQIERLYRSYFGRATDPVGLSYWRSQRAAGMPIEQISSVFAASPEFTATYGTLDERQFVELIYRNVLGRAADANGLGFWTDQLGSGASRGSVMVGFSESAEFVASTSTPRTHLDSEGEISRLYRAYFDRIPDPNGFCYWAGLTEQIGVDAVSTEFASSAEFTTTYGSLRNDQFVDLVYANVLNRTPDAQGKAFWTRLLDQGTSRGAVMTAFSESAEYLLQTDTLPAS